jgi:2'-5' RNA ligase superfamily
MSSEKNGASVGRSGGVLAEERLNVFALVVYIPDPLGQFLDDLRRELVPAYKPCAHVSVLPPRPLAVDWRLASGELRALAQKWAPFDIELTEIGVFPVTDVIYFELGQGAAELQEMHAAMASRRLAFQEPFAYHPHVTLAQEIPHSQVDGLREQAQLRWREYDGPRRFRANSAVFVQSTLTGCWVDLAEYPLGTRVAR